MSQPIKVDLGLIFKWYFQQDQEHSGCMPVLVYSWDLWLFAKVGQGNVKLIQDHKDSGCMAV